MSEELAVHNIRVNSLVPGVIKTRFSGAVRNGTKYVFLCVFQNLIFFV